MLIFLSYKDHFHCHIDLLTLLFALFLLLNKPTVYSIVFCTVQLHSTTVQLYKFSELV